ncbi:D-alanyl-D-alanine carboxypeptidase [Hazenella sp. IB182357]|uniref:serine-type D-Ala-D-Ala carboxypeptidase n=2 Tax=Polycladospora coralii TaxID=2771432 RepID=A0A926NCN6_9BACL|nr:D-alanyl-D-alanine carboxypeptidase family protein [Polycladospora coralii]MBD1372950.1 D-alanyl-D-alanine carboxypeptidase [Polycladospora coralii]MBS7530993.1 D-alanyl-D-alanine carboxypeptidase [Polycladospora coralii]
MSFQHGSVWAETDLAPSAQAAILMDASSGRVLYEKQASEEKLIASLTKIMTAVVAIEHGDLNELVTISENAQGVEGSSIYLKKGEKISLETLLYGLMLRSGNDAAVAIAEHIGGSVEGFVYMMNEKVNHLGLTHTQFQNPHGLDEEGHYSSAEDLGKLTAYALKNNTFQKIVETEVKTVSWPNEEWKRKFYNKNKMLRFYEWANGVKTGYTKKAHRTLVSSATKDGMQLVAVTLDDGNDWKESMVMFEYGFKHYEQTTILKEGQKMSKKSFQTDEGERVQITAGHLFQFPLTEEEKRSIVVEPVISFPLRMVKNDETQVGTARIYLKGEIIGSVPLVTTRESKDARLMRQFKQVFSMMMGRG